MTSHISFFFHKKKPENDSIILLRFFRNDNNSSLLLNNLCWQQWRTIACSVFWSREMFRHFWVVFLGHSTDQCGLLWWRHYVSRKRITYAQVVVSQVFFALFWPCRGDGSRLIGLPLLPTISSWISVLCVCLCAFVWWCVRVWVISSWAPELLEMCLFTVLSNTDRLITCNYRR